MNRKVIVGKVYRCKPLFKFEGGCLFILHVLHSYEGKLPSALVGFFPSYVFLCLPQIAIFVVVFYLNDSGRING